MLVALLSQAVTSTAIVVALGTNGLQAVDSTDLAQARRMVADLVHAFSDRDARTFSTLLANGASVGKNDIGGPMTLENFEVFTRGCQLQQISDAVRTTTELGRSVTAVDTHWLCPANDPDLMRMEFDIANGRIVSAHSGAPLR